MARYTVADGLIEAVAALGIASADDVRSAWDAVCHMCGNPLDGRGILTDAESSPKLSHDGGLAVRGAVVYLRQGVNGGHGNYCPALDAGCVGCYGTGGRARFDSRINAARQRRIDLHATNPRAYMLGLACEVMHLAHRAADGEIVAVRLNGLSDWMWESQPCGDADNIMVAFPSVQFYDYTRIPGRLARYNRAGWPVNYDLTFSLGADNDRIAHRALAEGVRVAVVMRTDADGNIPTMWGGVPTIDGDAHDWRFTEQGGIIVRLKPKGDARHDKTGWVRDADAGLELHRVPTLGRIIATA